MGFEVFLQTFNASETKGIPLDELIAILGDALSKSKDKGYDLKYGRRSRCYLSVTASKADDQLIIGMSVCRPIPDIRLWNSLFEILRVAPMCLYYPGDGPPLVAQPSLVRRKSPIFTDLGRPKVVRSGEAIRDAIVNDGKE